MAYTYIDYINIGKVSTYLSRADVSKGSLFGARIAGRNPQLPLTLAMETDSVNWIYEYDSTYSDLTVTTRYLYALCGKYGVQAIPIITGGGGGSVTPVSPTGYIYSEISDTITTGGSTYTNTLLVGGTDLTFVILNNQLLSVANGDFTFSSASGTLTFISVTLIVGDTIVIPFNKRL